MNRTWKMILWCGKISVGCLLFALGFNLFLAPKDLNAGGVSGLAMIFVRLTDWGYVGTITMLINLPLFIIGGMKVGRKFFLGSAVGMVVSSVGLDLLAGVTPPAVDPLLAALYGGVICGIGLGIVFSVGASTGGSDIIVRLLKLRWQHIPIGTISIVFDLTVVSLTGLAFQDVTKALYSGVAIFVTGQVIDAVVYRFDYSKVALIVTKEHEKVAEQIGTQLDRGATYLHGEGSYSRVETMVVLTAVKRPQVSELKRLVTQIDPDAFIIVQDAHQVLGDGFARYSKDAL